MKRKFIIGLVSAFVLGCMSIPVFAGAAPSDKVSPSYKAGGFLWLSHYEQLYCWTNQYDLLLNYTIRTKDKNGKKLDEKSGSKLTTYSSATYQTAKSTSAKSGYYSYKVIYVGFETTKWSASGNQS